VAWAKFKARDLIAIILFSIPFGGFIMVPYHLQRLRRRLRSESESRPTGGYR
jgi:TRAP-type C4-dicarboxylate transport system permease small subunit